MKEINNWTMLQWERLVLDYEQQMGEIYEYQLCPEVSELRDLDYRYKLLDVNEIFITLEDILEEIDEYYE